MSELQIAVAGVTVALRGLPPSLREPARARYGRFFADGPPALTIDVEPASLAAHAPDDAAHVEALGGGRFAVRYGALAAELALDEGVGRARVPESVHVVDSLLRITLTLLLGARDGLMLHASGVVDGERAYVFFGRSGAGKTTVARAVPPGDVLCDELVAVRLVDGAAWAFGTPFHGELPLTSPRGLPLGALVELRQAPLERVTAQSPAAGTRALLSATLFFCQAPALVERALDLCSRLSAAGVYVLQFLASSDARRLVRQHLAVDPHDAAPPPAGPDARG